MNLNTYSPGYIVTEIFTGTTTAENLSQVVIYAENIGNGAPIYDHKSGRTLFFNTLNAGSNIIITTGTTGITISSTGGAGSGSTIYDGASPTNVSVGGLSAGSNILGLQLTDIIERMVVTYLAPSFSSFSISAQPTIIEVGTALSGSKTFTWSTSNNGNISGATINVRDVTTNTIIALNTPNDGSQLVAIGTIVNNTPITHSWRGEGLNTQGNQFNSSNFTISSIYPYFFGKSLTRPTATATLITGGTKVVASSTGTISITYNASAEFLWFAIPSISTSKTVWYQSALNSGNIGGAVSPGGNLFPDFEAVAVTTVNWNGINYKLYISNYATTTSGVMEMRNS